MGRRGRKPGAANTQEMFIVKRGVTRPRPASGAGCTWGHRSSRTVGFPGPGASMGGARRPLGSGPEASSQPRDGRGCRRPSSWVCWCFLPPPAPARRGRVSGPREAEGCWSALPGTSLPPTPPPTAHRARDLPVALEPGVAGSGAAGWGAVASAPPFARLRDAGPVATLAPCALGPGHPARGLRAARTAERESRRSRRLFHPGRQPCCSPPPFPHPHRPAFPSGAGTPAG